ncbi:MAG: bifunctional phosphoribosylaminoimidazolecarboxamide formyltransferase/IMP cyclohydrolase [Chitinophagaceae bacterium]
MADKKMAAALISVFYKDGLEPVVIKLHELGVKLYSTGGTQAFIENLGVPCRSVESVTGYPSILGGRVKTLHPKVFGGILARRELAQDVAHVAEYEIPLFDLVIVDLYPFEETVKSTNEAAAIIEKIDIGGVSLIRAAGKNFNDVLTIASRNQYASLLDSLNTKGASSSLEMRKSFAGKAFSECAQYDVAIANYFNAGIDDEFHLSRANGTHLRYGENPHQSATFYGDIGALFEKLNGKELSFNNLVDVDAACQLVAEFSKSQNAFAVIKHTNVCGMAVRDTLEAAWDAALAGDKESAFGGVLISNQTITKAVAEKINTIFFEILIAPGFEEDALAVLKTKKNRILLLQKEDLKITKEYKRVLNGILVQQADATNFSEWKEEGARACTAQEKADLNFANIICKHLKSNAISIVKNEQLIGKGCGQTSRIDALRQSLEKARQAGFSTDGAVMASDAFFPFDDCVKLADDAGIKAVIQPGGSVRDGDSITYCKEHDMAMVMTGNRHFRH